MADTARSRNTKRQPVWRAGAPHVTPPLTFVGRQGGLGRVWHVHGRRPRGVQRQHVLKGGGPAVALRQRALVGDAEKLAGGGHDARQVVLAVGRRLLCKQRQPQREGETRAAGRSLVAARETAQIRAAATHGPLAGRTQRCPQGSRERSAPWGCARPGGRSQSPRPGSSSRRHLAPERPWAVGHLQAGMPGLG